MYMNEVRKWAQKYAAPTAVSFAACGVAAGNYTGSLWIGSVFWIGAGAILKAEGIFKSLILRERRNVVRAAEEGDIELVRLFLDRDAQMGNTEWVALVNAARNCHVAVVELLLDRGRWGNREEMEAGVLTTAVEHGCVAVVERLLDRGVQVNRRDELREETALMRASGRGHLEVVALLLNRGAQPNLRDWRGETALTRAIRNGHHSVVELLRNRGAQGDFRAPNRRTAVEQVLDHRRRRSALHIRN